MTAELGELRPEGLLTPGESYAALQQERGGRARSGIAAPPPGWGHYGYATATMAVWELFTENDVDACILLGSSGCGKTTVASLFKDDRLYEWNHDSRLQLAKSSAVEHVWFVLMAPIHGCSGALVSDELPSKVLWPEVEVFKRMVHRSWWAK